MCDKTSILIIAQIIKLNNANEGVHKITDAVCETSFELNSVHEINYENEITFFNILLFTYTCASADGSHILHTVPCSPVLLCLVARHGRQSKLRFSN